jgi:uncharacterized membrane protein YqiK
LTKLTETIEDRRKKRNDIEQDADLAIKAKNLETEQARLQILREEEYAKLQQEREFRFAVLNNLQKLHLKKQQKNAKQKKHELRLNGKLKSNVLLLLVMSKMKIF